MQLVQQKKYFESATHRRLLHEDQCEGIERVIPDTNGAGVPKGEATVWSVVLSSTFQYLPDVQRALLFNVC